MCICISWRMIAYIYTSMLYCMTACTNACVHTRIRMHDCVYSCADWWTNACIQDSVYYCMHTYSICEYVLMHHAHSMQSCNEIMIKCEWMHACSRIYICVCMHKNMNVWMHATYSGCMLTCSHATIDICMDLYTNLCVHAHIHAFLDSCWKLSIN